MPVSKHTAASKLAIVEEADRAARSCGGRRGVARKYRVSHWTLISWTRQRDTGELHERIAREAKRAAEEPRAIAA